MKTFRQFLIESPYETDAPVPVTRYLPNAPTSAYRHVTHDQALIGDIKDALNDDDLSAHTATVPLSSILPTQDRVSATKVEHKAAKLREREGSRTNPLVIPQRGRYVLIDGHHRVCALALLKRASVTVDVLNASDLDSWLLRRRVDKTA